MNAGGRGDSQQRGRTTLPTLHTLFRLGLRGRARLTPEEAAAIALGNPTGPTLRSASTDAAQRRNQRNPAPYLAPTTTVTNRRPKVALVQQTYNELREKERTSKDLVHDDFVLRNAAFEVDA